MEQLKMHSPDLTQAKIAQIRELFPGCVTEAHDAQVLLDWGEDLTLPIHRTTIQGKTVFFVDENALVASFDTGIDEDLVRELAQAELRRVVFRDNGFVSDAVKINVEQIFKQLSPITEVRVL